MLKSWIHSNKNKKHVGAQHVAESSVMSLPISCSFPEGANKTQSCSRVDGGFNPLRPLVKMGSIGAHVRWKFHPPITVFIVFVCNFWYDSTALTSVTWIMIYLLGNEGNHGITFTHQPHPAPCPVVQGHHAVSVPSQLCWDPPGDEILRDDLGTYLSRCVLSSSRDIFIYR